MDRAWGGSKQPRLALGEHILFELSKPKKRPCLRCQSQRKRCDKKRPCRRCKVSRSTCEVVVALFCHWGFCSRQRMLFSFFFFAKVFFRFLYKVSKRAIRFCSEH